MRTIVAAAIALFPFVAASPLKAEDLTYRSEYTVSAFGIPVGAARFDTVVTDKGYKMRGSVKSRGLASLFAPTTGTIDARGSIGYKSVEADVFAMAYTSGKDRQHTEIGFSRGAATRAMNDPKVKKPKDWIEVSPGHLQNTLDPLSAMLVRARSANEVCNRTIRVFDGAMRADIKLSYLRTVPFYTKGYRGDAVTCRARFVPVSGYPKNKGEIAWMRDKGVIDIAFAPVEGTDLFAPVSARISTQIGTIRIRATRFESTVPKPLEITVK
jgi:Protein of unknown function (DUF3108)